MTLRSFIIGLVLLQGTSLARADDTPPAPSEPSKPKAGAPAAVPGEPQANDILEKADAAARKIKSVKYTLHAQRIDVSDERASKLSGTVILSGWKDSRPAKFRYEVETRPGGRDESATVIVGYDGEQFWALNMRDKKVFAGETAESIGVYQLLMQYFPITEFVLPDPFGDELKAPQQAFRGTDNVHGEPCEKVHVIYRTAGQEATWYFSTNDHLPRRVDRLIVDPDDATLTRSSVITDLVVDPVLPDDIFSLVIPESFVKHDGAVP